MFCVSRIFCQNTIFDFTPFVALAVGPFSGIFLENVFFKIWAGVKKTLYLHVFWCLPDFFQNTIFDFTPFVALVVGPFSGIVLENVCFKIWAGVGTPYICLWFGVSRIFFKTRFST